MSTRPALFLLILEDGGCIGRAAHANFLAWGGSVGPVADTSM